VTPDQTGQTIAAAAEATFVGLSRFPSSLLKGARFVLRLLWVLLQTAVVTDG
jgi:hypothetical protein